MTVDDFGIEHEPHQDASHGHASHAEADAGKRAILAAMGVSADAPPASLKGEALVVEAGHARPSPGHGVLELEDGSSRAIHDHFPADLPLGYHRFIPDGGGHGLTARARTLYVTP